MLEFDEGWVDEEGNDDGSKLGLDEGCPNGEPVGSSLGAREAEGT